MKPLILVAAFVVAACARAEVQAQTCPPAGYDRTQLGALKAAAWALPNARERNRLARALTACVGAPDPALGDGVAFEGLQHWLRARALSDATMLAIADDLEAKSSADDANGSVSRSRP